MCDDINAENENCHIGVIKVDVNDDEGFFLLFMVIKKIYGRCLILILIPYDVYCGFSV